MDIIFLNKHLFILKKPDWFLYLIYINEKIRYILYVLYI